MKLISNLAKDLLYQKIIYIINQIKYFQDFYFQYVYVPKMVLLKLPLELKEGPSKLIDMSRIQILSSKY